MECLKQFQGIIFGYEIKILSYYKNLVYAAKLSEYQKVMLWRLILEEFWSNIQNIAGIENIVADTLSILPSTPCNKYKPCTGKTQCCANEFFSIGRV